MEVHSDKRIHTVVISLCDNDFIIMLASLMGSVKEVLEWQPECPPEAIETFIRDSIPAFYWVSQGRHWNVEEKESEQKRISEYFSKAKILFNEEAYKETEKDHDGGSAYLLVQTGEIGTF